MTKINIKSENHFFRSFFFHKQGIAFNFALSAFQSLIR